MSENNTKWRNENAIFWMNEKKRIIESIDFYINFTGEGIKIAPLKIFTIWKLLKKYFESLMNVKFNGCKV